MVTLVGGTDEKSFSLGALDFRGWRYLEVKLSGLLVETPYHLAGMRLVQDDNPVSLSGSFVADNLTRYPADESAVESVTDDASGITLSVDGASLTVNSATSPVAAIDIIAADGKLMISAHSASVNISSLAPAVYLVKINLADGTSVVRRVAIG